MIQLAKAVQFLPSMVNFMTLDLREALVRLYIRAFWARQGVNIERTARLYYPSHRLVQMASGVHVGNFTVLMALPTDACWEEPLLRIGARTYIGDQANLRAAGGLITIGSSCLLGNGVTMVASNHGLRANQAILDQPWSRGDIVVDDDVWIGAGATILPGVHLGRGSVVAAGAVVNASVEPQKIVGGIPARVIGARRE